MITAIMKRELKLYASNLGETFDYTIPRNKRELKQYSFYSQTPPDYTIPRNKRELKP